MHYFIFPSADSWISSGSSNVTGESFRDQNFGQDQILELKKEYFNNSFDYELFNMLGQRIKSGNLLEGNNEINLKIYSDGVYFINFLKENKKFTKKIIIKICIQFHKIDQCILLDYFGFPVVA